LSQLSLTASTAIHPTSTYQHAGEGAWDSIPLPPSRHRRGKEREPSDLFYHKEGDYVTRQRRISIEGFIITLEFRRSYFRVKGCYTMHIKSQHQSHIISAVNVVEGTFYIASYVSFRFLYTMLMFQSYYYDYTCIDAANSRPRANN
jgi:hypothetical protein